MARSSTRLPQPPAADALPGHLLIRASAGTGKTFQLSSRYLQLLDRGVSVEHILATTFTRKAAGEILGRVLERLAEAALDDGKCRELGESLGDARLTRASAQTMLAHLVRNVHRLRIGTLDSFFAQLARCFSWELQLPASWRMMDETEEQAVTDLAIEAVLEHGDASDLHQLVSLMTKGDAARSVGELLRGTVRDVYQLFVATDAAAWHALPAPPLLDAERINAALDQLRSLPAPGKAVGRARDEDCARAGQQDWDAWIEKGLAAKLIAGETHYQRQAIPAEMVAAYKPLIQHARGLMLKRLAQQTAGTYGVLERFHHELERIKASRGALAFDDVTRRLAQAVSGPWSDIRRLAYRLDAHLDHVLLDEFQDTSTAQWQVLHGFAREVTRSTRRGSFFCVGDEKQSIYGWRGGVAEIFQAVTRELPGLEERSLATSFRSAPAIITTVNRAFAGLTKHPNLQRFEDCVADWCRRFEPHTTVRTDLAGYACVTTSTGTRDEGSNAHWRWTAEYVRERAAESPGHSVGVLVRTNDTVARLIFELRALGVPASEEGGNPLNDSAAVQVILSLLSWIDHPGDSAARFHVAHSPLGTAWHIDGDAEWSLRVAPLRTELLENGYGATIGRWVAAFSEYGSPREQSRLSQLVERAHLYDTQATLRTSDFIRWVESKRVGDPTGAAVRVMTVHQSKGLEFDLVVLPELEGTLGGQPDAFVVDRESPLDPIRGVCRYANQDIRRLLPKTLQRMFEAADRGAAFDDLCALYVAVTRAIRALHMIIRPASPAEKQLPRTQAGLLRAALDLTDAAQPDKLLYETGDRCWFERSDKTTLRVSRRASARQPTVVRLRPTGAASRMRDRVAPSSLEATGGRCVADVVREGDRGARQRGRIIHAWLERIAWCDEMPPLPPDELQTIAARVLSGETALGSIEPLMDRFPTLLDRPALRRLLERRAYLDDVGGWLLELGLNPDTVAARVFNERPFAVFDAGQLVSGIIDRLVLLQCNDRVVAADIVDYKTDRVADDEAEVRQRVDTYRPQIAAYRRVVARLFQLDIVRVRGRLLFLEPCVLVTVS